MTDLLAILRGARLDVDEVGDWRSRRRPGTFAPVGVMVHHTAGTKSLDIIVRGRSDLPGPLANLHIPKAGPVNLVSGGRCNHAGAGAQVVLDEARIGRAPRGDAAARGFPDGPGGNGYFYGLECENLGNGTDPWPVNQLEVIARCCAAICRAHGWSAERVIGHREWTRRKPDPRGFTMASMRERVASILNVSPAPAPLPTPPTDYPEDKMRSTPKKIPLGDDGTGWIEVAVPAAKVVSITVNGMDIAGRSDTGRAIVCDHLAWGTGSRVVARASKPGKGLIDVVVWEVTG